MAVSAPGGLEEKLRRGRRLSRNNIAAYAWRHHRDDREQRISLAPHHRVICAHLQDPKRFPYVVFVVPPGYGKSTLASVIYPAWKMAHTDARSRVGMISNTATQAEGFAQAARSIMEGEEYQETFPTVLRDPRRKWTNREMFFTNTPQGANPGLMAMGMDGPILGKRFDEILLDDPSTWAQVRSEGIMEDQRGKVQNTIIQRFPASSRPPHGDRRSRMVVLMTRFGERDLLPLFRDDLQFHVVHMPALGFWDRIVKCSKCGQSAQARNPCDHDQRHYEVEFGEMALWPDAQSREELEALREHDELIFELVYQGNPSVLSGDMFSGDWFQRGELPSSFDRVMMGVDTAGGKDRKHGDYMAIVTLGFRGDRIWVIEAWRDRIPAPQQEDKIVQKYMQWRDMGWTPEMVVIEDANEGNSVYQHLVVKERMPLVQETPEHDKEFRAIAFSNAYRRRSVWHPTGERWVRAWEAELMAFPEGAHDDMLDAGVHVYNRSVGAGGPRLRVL